jgi:hypothetical protein
MWLFFMSIISFGTLLLGLSMDLACFIKLLSALIKVMLTGFWSWCRGILAQRVYATNFRAFGWILSSCSGSISYPYSAIQLLVFHGQINIQCRAIVLVVLFLNSAFIPSPAATLRETSENIAN